MECLFGLTRRKSGEILFQGSPVHIRNIRDAIRLGFGLVPENRKEEGLFPVRDISFNTTIEVLGSFIHGISVNSRKEKNIAEEYSGKMNVKASSLRQAVGKLSGGNQQKVMIARWLAARPQVLILDEPTRGIDVNAKAEIYYIINELAKNGMSIILISSELPELINMSDRIVVMNNGSVTGIIDSDFTQEKIMKLATTDVRDGE
jgi:ribose transport system ATP-binding protein